MLQPLYKVSVLLILIKFSTGLTLFKIDNLKDLNVLSKLWKTESTYDSTENIELIANKKQRVNKPNGFNKRNKILIKRKIPHGLDSGNYEFDHTFNTFYKPLVRVHKKNKFQQTFNSVVTHRQPNAFQEFESKYDLSTETNDDLYKKKTYDVWNESDKNYHKIRNTKDYDYVVYVTKRKKQKDKNKIALEDIYYNIVKKLKNPKAYKKEIPVLRKLALRLYQKSGEDHDPLAPGIKINSDVNGNYKKWMPHYTPWNYWTYKKTIHQDVCPGTQVRVANMCMWIPPH